MKEPLLIVGLGALCASASAQQPVTSADLVGAVMKASIIYERVDRRSGRESSAKFQEDWTIEFVSKDTIQGTRVTTVHRPAGTTRFPPEGGGRVTLGRPREVSNRGGGHVVWIFDSGVLTALRIFERGAVKHAFAVTRSGTGFDCRASISFPREDGSRTIVFRGVNDGVWTEIVSANQAASSCRMGGDDVEPGTPVPTKPLEPAKGDKCFTFERRQFCE
jgi:hypothetical protein